jgi:hypothetical protein
MHGSGLSHVLCRHHLKMGMVRVMADFWVLLLELNELQPIKRKKDPSKHLAGVQSMLVSVPFQLFFKY